MKAGEVKEGAVKAGAVKAGVVKAVGGRGRCKLEREKDRQTFQNFNFLQLPIPNYNSHTQIFDCMYVYAN